MSTERFQELVLGVTALIWGLVLLLPGDVFAGIARYAAFTRSLPDWTWGALLVLCGVILLPLTPLRWRKEAHAALGILWSLIVLLLLTGGLTPTTILLASPFLAMTLLHFFEYLNLSQLAKL